MLTREEIINYHLGSNHKPNHCLTGFEFEIFCLQANLERVMYSKRNEGFGIHTIFDYLVSEQGFRFLDLAKTIGVGRDGRRFTIEPGSQLEYSSQCNPDSIRLIKEFFELLEFYSALSSKFGVKWLDASLYPVGKAEV